MFFLDLNIKKSSVTDRAFLMFGKIIGFYAIDTFYVLNYN